MFEILLHKCAKFKDKAELLSVPKVDDFEDRIKLIQLDDFDPVMSGNVPEHYSNRNLTKEKLSKLFKSYLSSKVESYITIITESDDYKEQDLFAVEKFLINNILEVPAKLTMQLNSIKKSSNLDESYFDELKLSEWKKAISEEIVNVQDTRDKLSGKYQSWSLTDL